MTQLHGLTAEQKEEYPYRASSQPTGKFHQEHCLWDARFKDGPNEIGFRTYLEASRRRRPCKTCEADSIAYRSMVDVGIRFAHTYTGVRT